MHDSINTDCFQYYVHFITTDAALALFAVVTYFFICWTIWDIIMKS